MELPKKKSIAKWILLVVAAVIILLGLFVLTIVGFAEETNSRQLLVEQEKPKVPDYMAVAGHIVSIDLNKSDMVVRLSFHPEGNLANKMHLLTQNVAIYVAPGTKDQNIIYHPGDYVSPIDLHVDPQGEVALYPWDEHEGLFEIYVLRQGPNGEMLPVPVRLTLEGSVSGVKLEPEVDVQEAGSDIAVKMLITRSSVTRGAVWFGMVIVWILALTVLTMTIIVVRGRKLELIMFTFAATTLFSMVVFRNAWPGAPPIGTLSDYLSSFWGYAVVTLCLVALLITWARRRGEDPRLQAAAARQGVEGDSEPEDMMPGPMGPSTPG